MESGPLRRGVRVPRPIESINLVLGKPKRPQTAFGLSQGIPGAIVASGDPGNLSLKAWTQATFLFGQAQTDNPRQARLREIGQESNPLRKRSFRPIGRQQATSNILAHQRNAR